MKKLTWIGIISVLILAAALLPGCSRLSYVAGKGNIIDKQYYFSDFTDIDISSNIEIEIDPLSIYTISVRAYENLFDYIEISQSGKTLKIGLKPFITYRNLNMIATITLPELKALTMSDASHGTAKAFKTDQDFTFTGSGSSFLDMDMETGSSTFNLSGASQVIGNLKSTDSKMEISGNGRANLNGSANNLTLDASGAGRADLPNFILQNASVTLSGASQATLTLSGKLDADLSGVSSLDYAGNPSLGKINVTGEARLNQKQS